MVNGPSTGKLDARQMRTVRMAVAGPDGFDESRTLHLRPWLQSQNRSAGLRPNIKERPMNGTQGGVTTATFDQLPADGRGLLRPPCGPMAQMGARLKVRDVIVRFIECV